MLMAYHACNTALKGLANRSHLQRYLANYHAISICTTPTPVLPSEMVGASDSAALSNVKTRKYLAESRQEQPKSWQQ